ncbi:MAG: HEAT repeat domain-containing protein [Anaerolineaceae bacterium]|nr:MAG: HEAT repeat domain-containing protein [Anaerolineaceae bacterium]
MTDLNFNFSPENFGLGLLAGWGTAYAAYRARNFISEARRSLGSGTQQAREFAVRSADAGYLNDLVKFVQADHLAGGRISLSDVLVEPRFIKAPDFIAPREEPIVPNVFEAVPHIHDHPYLHAPYNIHTLAIDDLDNGDRAVALLGLPGSGRTTALHAIALWSLGMVQFEPPKDAIQQRMEEEERSQLKAREASARRYTERVRVEEIAEQTLSERRKGGDDAGVNADAARVGLPFRQLTPMYTHLANVNISVAEFGRRVDPAEPLVRALQHYVSYNTRMKMARNIYQRLNDGRALLLLDGLDELPTEERARKLDWLARLREMYGEQNFIIVTASPRGYGGLSRAGYTPVFVRPWHDEQSANLTDLWAQNWRKLSGGGRRQSADIDAETMRKVRGRSRNSTPFEQTLRTWSIYDSPTKTGLADWLANYLTARAPSADADTLHERLVGAATLQLEQGYILPEALSRLIAPVESAEADDLPTDDDDTPDDISARLDDFEMELDSLRGDDPAEGEASGTVEVPAEVALDDKKNQRLSAEALNFLKEMVKAGILRRYRGGRYQFSHVMVAAYFASFALPEMDDDEQIARADDPTWRDAFIFAAAHTPLDNVVRARMDAPLDVLLNQLLDAAQWIRYAGGKVEWVPGLLRTLGKLFAARKQYPTARERIAAALVGTGDRNAVRIFERSLNHPDATVRRLSCLGLGALRHGDDVGAIAALMGDSDPKVQIAAGLALGVIGTDEALEEMAVMFTQGHETMRQTIAESFAAIPDEGYPVLFDAVSHEDMMLRRAAVFGLRRIRAPWALIYLHDVSLADDEWYVKSAAEQAFLDLQYGIAASGPRRYPQPEQIDWLKRWVDSVGDLASKRESGERLLRRALEEGPAEVQYLAVGNLGQLAAYGQMGTIYSALRHREYYVREAAYRALGDIQMQMGEALPTPISVS